ncbi:hypothetical protein TcWFU_008749 [Taenia crassiceps]|uniref:Ras-GAP domain-containing protein n=1 Tax=Taenia crassiceps TaxID=6207 RepID=A0ABR4Q3U4_9CEST
MDSSLFTCLRDSIFHQNVHDCFRALQHPKLHLSELLEPSHKEWYFVVLENNLGKIARCLDGACGNDATLARSLKVSVKLANAYARREVLLDQSLQKINTAIQRDDPIVTMSALIEHNDNMNGIARHLVGTLSVEEIYTSVKLRTRVDLIHEELKAALREKGKHLTYEEMLTVLRVLHHVIALNEAVSIRNESKIMPILSAKDALWENVVESKGDWGAAYYCRLCSARNNKSTEIGRPSVLSHCEIQRIINEVAKSNHSPCKTSTALTMDKFEAFTSADEESTDASITYSVSPVKTCEYYLSRLNRSLAPGNEFVLWGWLQALRTTGYLSSVSAQLSSEHIDLYRRVLSTLHTKDACNVKIALKSAHKIHARALALGKALAEFNNLLHAPNGSEGLERYILKLEDKRLTSCNTALKLNVEREHIEKYVEALLQVKTSKAMGTLNKNLKTLHGRRDCHSAENYGWLVTSLAGDKEGEDDIYFYFNIKSQKLIWKPSYTTPEPTYLEPGLLSREEIERCISQVNLNVPLQQIQVLNSPKLRIAALRILQFIRKHRRRRFVKQTVIGLRRVLRCIRRFQALWRGFTLRRMLNASLALALNPTSQSACERPLVSLLRLCSSSLVPSLADNIYKFQLGCIHAAQSTADNAEQLMSLQEEIERSSELLHLAEQMHREAVASKLRRPTLCFSTTTLCGGSRVLLNNLKQSQTSPSEQISQKYSGLVFLLYAEPDYLARLLIELPSRVLWVEKKKGVLENCKPSDFALRLERIILSFYNYGKRGGGEVSLTFLITRALHMQLYASSWNDIKGMRGHFALRLAVAMTHVSHSMKGTVVQHLVPLLQDILIADAKRQEKESGSASRKPEKDVIPSLLNNSRSNGNSRKPESANAMEMAVALPREENEKRQTDVTSVSAVARALSRTPSKVANVSWLAHVGERLFYALFEEKGGVTLPSPLLRLIQEVFCLMRQVYPHQPIKDLLKFIGLHLFYRYIHSIILAPDAFTSTVTDSKKLTLTMEKPKEIQRATLAGLSRLLCLVVENKGIACNTEIADQTQALNSLIKMWHVRFKTYLLNLIGDQRRCWDPPAGRMHRLAEAWIGRLPCSQYVSTEARSITINVEESRSHENLFRYYRFNSNNSADLVLPEGTRLQLSIKAKSPKELANACLYTARALGLASIACFSFASRTCCSFHTRNPKSSCLHDLALSAKHTFQPEAKNCIFCASERVHRRPLDLIFGWTEALPPTEKSIRLLCRRTSNGLGMSGKFAIGETHRRTRFTIGQDGVIVSATPNNGEKIVWPVEAREVGASWTRAKQAMMHIFSCLAAHRDILSEELLLEKQRSVSNLQSWFSLLRSQLARATVKADARYCKCLPVCASRNDCTSVKRLQEGANTLHEFISNIQTTTGENITTLWHDLIADVARDVFHMDAACVDAEWRNISDRLAAVNCILQHRIHRSLLTLNLLQQALSHSLRPQCPLNSKFAIRCGGWLHEATANVCLTDVNFSRRMYRQHNSPQGKISGSDWCEPSFRLLGESHYSSRGNVCGVERGVGGWILSHRLLLDVQWEEPEEVEVPHLLWSLHCGESTLTLFSRQLHFNLAPFVKMLFNKFYATPAPTQLLSPASPPPPSPSTFNANHE